MAPPIGRPYHKNYEIGGNKFTIQVAYQGNIPMGYQAQVMDTWFYNLMVDNTTIEMGQWRDLRDAHPTNEEVCDALAQFWHDSKKVTEAQVLGEDENKAALQELVEKCAKRMFYYFMKSEEPFDYEIVHTYMDEYGWDIILSPNIKFEGRRQMLLHFSQFPQQKDMWIRVYELERSAYIKL